MLNYIEIDKLENKPKFSLCLPLPIRSKINNLKDIDNVQLKLNLGKVHELSFDMPFYVERDNELVKNPLIEKFDAYYQVKMVWNDITEYFVYISGNRKLDNNGNTVSYKLYSSAYLLSKKIERLYEEVSKPLSHHAKMLLSHTNWTLDFVDVDFDLKYRTIEFSESNILQALYDLAIKFNALIIFDNVNLKVSFHKPEHVGLNKGMTFKPSTFIETLGQEINFDEIVTRLNVYGSEGLEFRRLSPTGSNYIESLDWFIHPFTQDSSGNVIKHSKWLTDSLCKAYISYQEKLKSVTPTFKTLTTNKTAKEDEITQAKKELMDLEAELKQIENDLWVVNKTYMDEAPNRSDWVLLVSRKSSKESEIVSKKSIITGLENQLKTIQTQIDNLAYTVNVENPVNFTRDQIIEMNEFIHQKSYTNDSIIDEQELLDEGINVFKEVGEPPVTIKLGLVNFLNDIEFKPIHNRIALGDTVKVKSKEIDIYVELKILEVNYNISNDTLELTISNMKDLRDDYAKLVDKIYSSSNTSTTVDMDKNKWDKVTDVESNIDKILNEAWDAAKNAIFGGHKDTTILDEWGLKSYDSQDKNTFLFINNGIFGITNSGGNDIEVAISKDGVFSKRLTGAIILSRKVWVEDALGIVEIESGLQTIYDQNGKPRVQLGRYPTFENPNSFKYGLKIIDGSFDIRTSDSTNMGVQIDGEGIRAYNTNRVKTFEVNAKTGQVSIIGGISIKTHPDSKRGVEIDGDGLRIYNNSGTLVFNADHYGNIFYKGKLDGAYGTVDNLGGTLDNMDGTFKGDLKAAGGTFTGTLNGVDGNFSGELRAATGTFGGVVTGSLNAVTGTFDGIVTGTLSTSTARAVEIDVDQLRANNAAITNLSAISSDLGHITGGSIEIDTDMYIGNNLYLGQRDGGVVKNIIFNRRTRITGNNTTMTIGASNIIFEGDDTVFEGTVDFSNARVIGL